MKKRYIYPSIDILDMEVSDLLVVLSGEPVNDVVAGGREMDFDEVEDADEEEFE